MGGMIGPTIAIDAMGADHSPEEIVRGAARLSLESDVDVLLVGDEPEITRILAGTRHNPERLAVHHSSQVISRDEAPSDGYPRKPDASIAVAARLVSQGRADALVSGGNIGACILACKEHLALAPGIEKPALSSVFATRERRGEKEDPFSLILDTGAGLEASADDLVSFAKMGAAYARVISRNERPRVALLSSGMERGLGPPEVEEAHLRLQQLPGIEFLGKIEGKAIPEGGADVVVTSGFVGNVALRMLEGVSETVLELARYAYKERLIWRLGLTMLSGGISRLKKVTDWEQYGGAPILGYEKVVIKVHGGAKAQTIVNAGKIAAKAVAAGVPSIIGSPWETAVLEPAHGEPAQGEAVAGEGELGLAREALDRRRLASAGG